MKFSAQDGRETRNDRQHFRGVVVKSLNSGLIFPFPGFVFVSNIMENRWSDFNEIFMKFQGWHKKQ